ncbi:MAG: hypothetical protein ACK5Z2_19330 [Bacteroidota bacterium]
MFCLLDEEHNGAVNTDDGFDFAERVAELQQGSREEFLGGFKRPIDYTRSLNNLQLFM